MSFSVENKSAPITAKEYNQNDAKEKASARERAIKALIGGPQVQNNNQVSPEEVSVVTQQNHSENQPSSSESISQNTNSAAPVTQESQAESTASAQAASEATSNAAAPKAPSLDAERAHLARKERALRMRELELRRREEAARAQLQPKEQQVPARQEFDSSAYISKEELKKNPFKALVDLGITYDQVTQEALNAPSSETIQLMQELKSVREELAAIKADSDSTKKGWEQAQQANYQQAIKQMQVEVSNFVKGNDEFEMINATRSSKDVVDLIERTYNEEGYIMSIEDAAKAVEDYLTEESLRIAKTKKISGKLAPAPAQTPVQATPKQESPSNQPQKSPAQKTLTNAMSTTRPLTARERAKLAFEGKLK